VYMEPGLVDRIRPCLILGSLRRRSGAGQRSAMGTIVIDPGHGGKDPGDQHLGFQEKTINLAVAKQLNSLLSQRGFRTV